MGATLSYETGKRSSKLGSRMYPYEPSFAVQLHQSKFSTEDEWIRYMKMNVDAQNTPAYDYNLMILKPPQHLFEVKPESYCPKLVTIGPLYQNLQKSPIDRCKALCMKKFIGRHGLSGVEDLMKKLITDPQDLRNIYIELPAYNFEFLKLLVTVDTVFIHEFLLYWPQISDENLQKSESSSYFSTFYIKSHTLPLRLPRDLLLIGNQIPMSYLKKIARDIGNNRDFSLDHLKATVRSFIMKQNPFFSHDPSFYKGKHFKIDLSDCQHLLDALYVSCTETFKSEGDSHQVFVDVSRPEGVQGSVNDSRPKPLKEPHSRPGKGQASDSEGSGNGSRPGKGQASDSQGSGSASRPGKGQAADSQGSGNGSRPRKGQAADSQISAASDSCPKPGQAADSQGSAIASRPKPDQESNAVEKKKHTKKHRRLPPASELSKAGISFKPCKGNISVMKYHKDALQLDLPCLVVYDTTEDVLRSLIAHEKTSERQKEFTMYAKIMDMLIDTEEDLAILTKANVIENHLGNGERLVDMWNGMCTGMNVEENPHGKWEQMIHDIVAHHSSRWRRWYVEFRAVYFSRPWLPISILAAFTLLSASIVQTIYTVLGFYQSDDPCCPKT